MVFVIWDNQEKIGWFLAGTEFLELHRTYINAVGDKEKEIKLLKLMYGDDYATNGTLVREINWFDNPLTSVQDLMKDCIGIVVCGELL